MAKYLLLRYTWAVMKAPTKIFQVYLSIIIIS